MRQKTEEEDRSIMDAESVRIRIGGKATLVCELAYTEQAQTVGLQKYASMPGGYGMAFLFEQPKSTTFHMGTVAFPIDIMFVGQDNRISKIVKYAEPGTREKWSMSRVSVVLEANAGFCDDNGIEVGDEVKSMGKSAQETFPDHPRKDINPKMVPPDKTSPSDRFRDRAPVDLQVEHQDPGTDFEQQMGRDPSIDNDTDDATRP